MQLFKKIAIFVVPILFLIIGIITLSDYGIDWDESLHFQRGQAYLHYFLTGKRDFLDLPSYPELRGTSDFIDRAGESPLYKNSIKNTNPTDPSFRRSYYQSDVFNFSLFVNGFDGGHPPTSDIFSAFFNYIFYQKLGVTDDIESYHLFEIVIASLLVLGVGIFVYYNFGLWPSVTASLSLALYPLFFAESHFNIKDPTEASFFGLSIISFFFGAKLKNFKLIVLSAVLVGFALGTKFNALFLPLIVGPWFVFGLLTKKITLNLRIILSLFLFPVIVIGIFLAFWPFLWSDWGRLGEVINYYQGIGLGTPTSMEKYILFGFNTYPIKWIIYTTPLPILIMSGIGLLFSLYLLIKRKSDIALLTLLWLWVPLARVSLPGANIYGGVRQIMEFLPVLAIICGISIFGILHIKNKFLSASAILVVVLSFIFIGRELIEIHPNENVYFNQLIGGLSGAQERNIPSWGNSYGNVYLQGVEWLNQNAPADAKLGLPINVMTNVPRSKLRPDIYFSNSYPSGPQRQGEYVMEIAHDWPPKSWYGFAYYDMFLTPVHEIKVDGVSLLKIWKNDLAHTKPGFEKEREYMVNNLGIKDNIIKIELKQEIFLTRLEIKHLDKNCDNHQVGGYIRVSNDGINWRQEPETIDYPQIPTQWLKSDKNTFVFLLPARSGKFLFLDTQNPDSCILKITKVKVFGLSQ
ncbi:glycosyltransferase family 39 protein [Candidatus Microgenomates bacterium]|nr:glycosyltransferase family 39 protein [Candidatus Microgenomates bacterium]